MRNTDVTNEWVGVARETFERSMVPWIGRKYERWLRAWARPHPVDPGQILVPGPIYRVYRDRAVLEPLARWQLDAMGYPELPPREPVRQGASVAPAGAPVGRSRPAAAPA